MIKKIAHVCFGASDLAKTRKFYCDCLGLKELFIFTKQGRKTGMYLEVCRGNYLEFFQGAPKQYDDNVIRHICLEVKSVDEIVRRLREYGYEATDKKMGADNSWQAWTSDPDGTRIEFHEYTPDSSQLTGRECVLD